ncbi:MAG: helix-turn-helix domain-containing protein [Chloroflexota bacterium]
MSRKFSEFLEEIEAEAQAEGPAAVAELTAFDERYRLAHQLLTRRRDLGMTQAKLAKITGIGQADISRIETGRANPTVSTLAVIARALGLGLSLFPVDTVSDQRNKANGTATASARRLRRSTVPA